MKKVFPVPGAFVLLAALVFSGTSCGSLSPGVEAEKPVPAEAEEPAAAAFPAPAEAEEPDTAEPLPEAEIPLTEETPAEVVPAGPLTPETNEYGLPEPEADFAEVLWPAPPREEEDIGALPEPQPPVMDSEAEPVRETPEPVVEMPVPTQEPAPEPPAPATEMSELAVDIPEPAAPMPAPLPGPPRNLRPTEPLPPPPMVREEPPVPVNPVPDLPARNPESVLLSPGETEDSYTFSRVVRVTVGQLVEVPFRGTGWVFLGEAEARRGIAYGSRRLDPEGQSFVFRAEEKGDYTLKFYKQDFIRDYVLNDYVRVIVGEIPEPQGTAYAVPPVNRERVIAEPRWPLLPGAAVPAGGTVGSAGGLPPGAARSPETAVSGSPGSSVAGAVQTEEPAPPPVSTPAPGSSGTPAAGAVRVEEPALPSDRGLSGSRSAEIFPEEYIRRAREEYEAGRIEPAREILDQFREAYPAGSDEAWWLYGRIFEANGPNRDIRSALDYYRRLIREYPQSSRFDDARRRAAYLERYYFNIQ